MTVDEFIALLHGVRRTSRGVLAKCPAHDDRNPSLSVHLGDRGLLVKCWAGCRLEDICAALGIRQTDLFFDSLTDDPRQRREAARQRAAQRIRHEAQQQAEGLVIDALREAEYFVRSRQDLNISTWNHERLHEELHALADAYHLLACEDLDGHYGY